MSAEPCGAVHLSGLAQTRRCCQSVSPATRCVPGTVMGVGSPGEQDRAALGWWARELGRRGCRESSEAVGTGRLGGQGLGGPDRAGLLSCTRPGHRGGLSSSAGCSRGGAEHSLGSERLVLRRGCRRGAEAGSLVISV